MFAGLSKHGTNIVLALLGFVALVHSLLAFGTGALPEAVLALLLLLKAFADRRQPWSVTIVGILALGLTWAVNSALLTSIHLRQFLSWLGILAFAVLAFSRYLLERSRTGSGAN